MKNEDGCHLVIACRLTAGGARAPHTSSTIDFVVVVKIPFSRIPLVALLILTMKKMKREPTQ